MSSDNQEQKIDISDVGEEFVYRNHLLLFNRLQILRCVKNTSIKGKEKTEGADLEAWAWEIRELRDGERPVPWADIPEGKEETAIDAFVKGPIEVKASSFKEYLAYTDDRFDFEGGVISFAIWNRYNKYERYRERLGSLFRMFYPVKKERERQPIAYVAVFMNLESVPYACLIFEDFPKLQKRLIEIGSERGIDLTHKGMLEIPCWKALRGWRSPYDWEKRKTAQNPKLWLKGHMWYVELSRVIDLVKVVLIGEPPKIVDGYNECSRRIQEERWEYLKQHSWKTIPLVTDEALMEPLIKEREKHLEHLLELFPNLKWGKKIDPENADNPP